MKLYASGWSRNHGNQTISNVKKLRPLVIGLPMHQNEAYVSSTERGTEVSLFGTANMSRQSEYCLKLSINDSFLWNLYQNRFGSDKAPLSLLNPAAIRKLAFRLNERARFGLEVTEDIDFELI
jgi:hypothetical protein